MLSIALRHADHTRKYHVSPSHKSGWDLTLIEDLQPTRQGHYDDWHPAERAASARLYAQGAGASLGGKVLDPDSKVVVSAAVIVRNEATGEIRTTTTDGVGHFSVTSVTPGLYTLEVVVPGFEIVRRSGVRAAAGTPEDVIISLSVANISEKVTVATALPPAA